MKIEVREPLPSLTPEEAFRRWREELPSRAGTLPPLEILEVREGRSDTGERERHLVFSLALKLSPLARNFLPRDTLTLELAEAFGAEGTTWSLHSLGLSPRAAMAGGTLAFRQRGSGSELVADGSLRVDLGAIPQLPRFLLPTLEPALQRGLSRSIEKAFAMLAGILQSPQTG